VSEPTIYACAGPDDCSVPCDMKMVALADYERLTRELANNHLYVEREKLRIDNERLTRENEPLRARVPELTRRRKVQEDEIERLTRENAELLKATGVIEAGLLHEIERLRAALIAWHEACDDEEREWARERGLKALSQEPKP
jgi:hypothetical protein